MAVSSILPNTTTAGGITSQASALGVPPVPAVTGGAQNYDSRMAATQALVGAGNGSLAGGGRYRIKRNTIHRRNYNNITKVMKGCSSKKTRRHNKKKRHGKRIFRGGAANITPAGANNSSQIQLNMPGGASKEQIDTLKELTGGLFAAQTAGTNTVPSIPAPSSAASRFSGGGLSRRRHRNTKYRRLRYKKSIGRKSRSYRRSGRR
jgi:hypothetical protein